VKRVFCFCRWECLMNGRERERGRGARRGEEDGCWRWFWKRDCIVCE
jgi:hypothetical protein